MTMEWEERYAYASKVILPWISQSANVEGFVVEFGCGNASVTTAVAERAEHVLGLDIDEAAVGEGRAKLAGRGLANAELVSGSFEELVAALEERRGEIDLFLLFAVLEHMTLDERLRILSLAGDVVSTNGAIAVVESPNRLLWWDYHTSELPFFGMLPDELALRYFDRSQREDFKEEVAAAIDQGESAARERLSRWGRGVSFHEFELAFDDFPANVVACNYEPELLGVREIHREELALARFLRRVRPDIPPSFSRYWLDLVITPGNTRPRRFFEPWPFETTNSRYVDFTEWDTLLLRGPHARLTAIFDSPTNELLIGVLNVDAPLELRVHAGADVPISVKTGPPDDSAQEYLRVRLEGMHHAVTLDASEACNISFLGFAAVS